LETKRPVFSGFSEKKEKKEEKKKRRGERVREKEAKEENALEKKWGWEEFQRNV